MRPPKRQWRDDDGVVHEVLGRPHTRRAVPLKCWRRTPAAWQATRDAPTCLECVAYVPLRIRIN